MGKVCQQGLEAEYSPGESAQEVGPGWGSTRPTLCDPLPPMSLYPQPPQEAPPPGDQVAKHVSLWGTFYIQAITSSGLESQITCF